MRLIFFILLWNEMVILINKTKFFEDFPLSTSVYVVESFTYNYKKTYEDIFPGAFSVTCHSDIIISMVQPPELNVD